jgi:type IV pilus assembly protein PilY1
MRNFISGSLVVLSLLVGQARADDIEIYFTEGVEASPYVLLIPDFSPNGFSRFSALSGIESSMTAESWAQFQQFRADDTTGSCVDGDGIPLSEVSRWEVYRAVLASVLRLKTDGGLWVEGDDLDELLFGDLTIAIAAPNFRGGANLIQGYGKLSDGVLPELLKDFQALPCTMSRNNSHKFSIKDTYVEWLAYINGFPVVTGMDTNDNFLGPPPYVDYDPNTIDFLSLPDSLPHGRNPGEDYDSPFDSDSCPALYSIAASMTGTPPGQDDTIGRNEVAHGFPESAFDSSPAFMEYIHSEDAQLLPAFFGDDVPIRMEKSWIITDTTNPCDPNADIFNNCTRGDVGRMAEGAGTVPLDITDGEKLEADLKIVFGEILSVSASFVSASVPVNVFNQTETLDNIYTALFEAQDTLNWPGNIKKLQLDDSNDDGVFDDIVDVNGGPGFETTGSNKGRIFYSALTFWTDTSELDNGFGDDPDNPDFVPSGKDGRVVDRGGSGQQVPGQVASYPYFIGDANGLSLGLKTSRTVYVEDSTLVAPNGTTYTLSDDNLDPFNAGSAASLQVALDANDVTEATELIRWGRGMDVDAAPGDPTTAARGWITGDSIHSRPFALNYGGAGTGYDPNNPNIRLLFGTGNGSFHMIDNTDSSGNESGKEVFAYYPLETLAQLRRRRDTAKIDDGTDMRYGVDGEVVVLTVDANNDLSLTSGSSGDEALAYFGLRRGGFSYHALDVINPSSPQLQWKITHTRDVGSSDFDELGLSFSTPRVTTVNYQGNTKDVLVFAGGYYGGWDPNDPGATSQIGKDVPSGGADSWGNAVYIVDARSGELIWKVTGRDGGADATSTTTLPSSSATKYVHEEMDHSIPSDVTILENDAGILHRIYVGDTGGNVWRMDTPSGTCASPCTDQRTNWFASRLGNLANGSDIRFFHAPDVVEVKDESTGTFFDGVLIQGGNRADPLDRRFAPVQNYLYYMRDYEVTSGVSSTVIKSDGTGEVAQYEATDLIDRTACITEESAGCTSFGTNNNGWKIQLGSPGEKGLSTPLVDFGRVFSSTYVPGSSGTCGSSPEGFGKLYVTSLTDGTAVGNQHSYTLGPGIPPSPVIIGEAIWLPGGGVDADLDGDEVTDDLLTKSFTQRLIPIYWREPGIDDL